MGRQERKDAALWDQMPHQRRRVQQLADQSLDALLVGPSPDFRYLTGYLPPALERLTMLVVPAQGEVRLVVPALEAPLAHDQLGDLDVEVVSWRGTDAEVEALARVAAAIDQVVSGLPELRWAGRTEREIARELDRRIREVHDDTLF